MNRTRSLPPRSRILRAGLLAALLGAQGSGCSGKLERVGPDGPTKPSATRTAGVAAAESATPEELPTLAFPDTPAGARAQQLVATFNDGSEGAISSFVNEGLAAGMRDRFPIEQHVEMFGGIHQDFPQLQLKHVDGGEAEFRGYLQSAVTRGWIELIVQVEEAAPHRVVGIHLQMSLAPVADDDSPLSEAQLVQTVSDTLRGLCTDDVFSGTVLLAKGDAVLLTHACGEASKSFHVRNDIDTKFNLGSMNKMFTATAIARLVEQGVLTYDEPISKYVDESWLPKEITDRVTIHHLLTHTSGLGDYFNETFSNGSRERYRTIEDFKQLVKGDSLAFEPGARFSYSNTGMLLLGVVIERASGQDYFDHVREHIYTPAGMTHSDSYEMDAPVENLAIGYMRDRDSEYGWRSNIFAHVIKGGPAGGGFSTVGDLHRFARALQTGKLVSDVSLTKMWIDHSGVGYGYGFQLEQGPAGRVVGHGGGFSGISAQLDMYADRGYVVAVLSNYDGIANPVANRVEQLIARTTE